MALRIVAGLTGKPASSRSVCDPTGWPSRMCIETSVRSSVPARSDRWSLKSPSSSCAKVSGSSFSIDTQATKARRPDASDGTLLHLLFNLAGV